MDYQVLVDDFTRRTRANLVALRHLRSDGVVVYEVTALVNSMLGLLVFPQQSYVDRLPEVPLDELVSEGWPMPAIQGEFPQVPNLRQLVRHLRNAISHFNVEFDSDSRGEISGLTLWNTDFRGNVTWKARLSIDELDSLASQFVALLLNESPLANRHPIPKKR